VRDQSDVQINTNTLSNDNEKTKREKAKRWEVKEKKKEKRKIKQRAKVSHISNLCSSWRHAVSLAERLKGNELARGSDYS
jgi:hypothetical protein